MKLNTVFSLFVTRLDYPLSIVNDGWIKQRPAFEGWQGLWNKFLLQVWRVKAQYLASDYNKGYLAGYAQGKIDSQEETNKGAFLKALAKSGVDRLHKQEPDWVQEPASCPRNQVSPPVYEPPELLLGLELNKQRQRADAAELALAKLQQRVKDIVRR